MALPQKKAQSSLATYFKGTRILVVSPTVPHDEEARARGYHNGPAMGPSIYGPTTTVNPRATLLMALKEIMDNNKVEYGIDAVWGESESPILYGGDGVVAAVFSSVSNEAFSKMISDACSDIDEEWPKLKSDYVVQDASLNVRYINGEKLEATASIAAQAPQPIQAARLRLRNNGLGQGHLNVRPPGE